MASEPDFRCYHCNRTYAYFNEVIDHNIIFHPETELKFKRRIDSVGPGQKTLRQTKNFSITPTSVKDSGCFIYSDIMTETVKVSKLTRSNESFLMSPICKKQKVVTSTPAKKSLFSDYATGNAEKYDSNHMEIDDLVNEDEFDLSAEMINLSLTEPETHVDDIEDEDEMGELHALLPYVLKNLKSADQLETYMKFNRMIAEETFPLTNIAYLLFVDVVNWFSSDTTSQDAIQRRCEEVLADWDETVQRKILKIYGRAEKHWPG